MPASIVFASFALSLDGYIASASRDLAWLNNALARDEDYGFAATMQRTGAYVIGANTYQEMLGLSAAASGDATPTYVVTHRADWPKAPAHVHFVSGDLRALLANIQSQTDKDLWVFGGGDLVTQCLALDLLDELSLAIVPVLLGGGLPLFRPLPAPINLRLAEAKPYKSGIVLLKYGRASAPPRPRRGSRARHDTKP